MEKKFLLSLFLIIVMLLPVISCSQLQEKPFDATGLPADEVVPYPSTAIAGNTGQTKTEGDTESSLPDLQKLQKKHF